MVLAVGRRSKAGGTQSPQSQHGATQQPASPKNSAMTVSGARAAFLMRKLSCRAWNLFCERTQLLVSLGCQWPPAEFWPLGLRSLHSKNQKAMVLNAQSEFMV